MIRNRLSCVLVMSIGFVLFMVFLLQTTGKHSDQSYAPIKTHLERLTQALNENFNTGRIVEDDVRPHRPKNILGKNKKTFDCIREHLISNMTS